MQQNDNKCRFSPGNLFRRTNFSNCIIKIPVDTKNDFSHPGYQERFNSLNKFIYNYEKEKYLKSFKPYKWKWSYDRKNKILKFKPLSPQVVPNKFSL